MKPETLRRVAAMFMAADIDDHGDDDKSAKARADICEIIAMIDDPDDVRDALLAAVVVGMNMIDYLWINHNNDPSWQVDEDIPSLSPMIAESLMGMVGD